MSGASPSLVVSVFDKGHLSTALSCGDVSQLHCILTPLEGCYKGTFSVAYLFLTLSHAPFIVLIFLFRIRGRFLFSGRDFSSITEQIL